MKNKNKKSSETAILKRQLRDLKSTISNQNRKIRKLVSEIKTLESALNSSTVYIDDRLTGVSVDELVKEFSGDESNIDLDKMVDDCKEELEFKWQCYSCEPGYLRLIVVNRLEDKMYFRKCSHCDNRTKIQKFDESVKGL